MWWWTAIALATPASQDAAFYRHDDALVARRYTRISEGQGPAHARGRGPSGEFQAWTFRDGVVEHYERWKGKRLVEEGTFDAYGERLATVSFAAAAPSAVVIAGREPHPVDVAAWVEQRFNAPPPAGSKHGTAIVLRVPTASPAGAFRATIGPEGDVFSDTFRDGLIAGCGCTIVDRSTAWIGGRVGARYLLDVPDAAAAHVGEVWAVPVPGGTFVASFTAPRPDADALGTSDLAAPLAVGRAIVAMARWEST